MGSTRLKLSRQSAPEIASMSSALSVAANLSPATRKEIGNDRGWGLNLVLGWSP
ncbi:MAG: hypothetical protein HC800_12110 [Phormidesmis sp. RL_2_1]|nr:hypothetical protein [Phormidesmis sp. RL_2_1]